MAMSAFRKNEEERILLGGCHTYVHAQKSLALPAIQSRNERFALAITGDEVGNLLRGQRLIAAKDPCARNVQDIGVFLEAFRKPVERCR